MIDNTIIEINDVHRNADVNNWRSFVFETSKNANGPKRQMKQSITFVDQKSKVRLNSEKFQKFHFEA